MSIKNYEERIASELKWQNISQIPNIPARGFDDLKRKIKDNILSIGIDYTTANQLSEWIFGKKHYIIMNILASTPVIVALLSIIFSIYLGNYWLLFGVILGFGGQLMSNPYNPISKIFKPIVGILFLLFLYGIWQGKEILTLLTAFFVFPFIVNSYLYEMNNNKIKQIAQDSEILFIYLYQEGKLGIKEIATGETLWHRENRHNE